MFMKGRKHVLFEKSLFAHQGKLLRHIQLSLTRRQAMAILALIPQCACLSRPRVLTSNRPWPLPADRHLSQLEESLFSFLIFLSSLIHPSTARLSQESHLSWRNAFSMVIINDSFLHSWPNSRIDLSSHTALCPLAVRIPKHWLSHVSAWQPLLYSLIFH